MSSRQPKRMTDPFEHWLHVPNQPVPTPLEFVKWLDCMVDHLDYAANDADQFGGQMSLLMDALTQYQIARGADHRVGWRISLHRNGKWTEWGTWWRDINGEAERIATRAVEILRGNGETVDCVLVKELRIQTTEAINNGHETKASGKDEQATGQGEA